MVPRVYSNGRALSFHSPLLHFEVALPSIKPRAVVEHTWQLSAEVSVGRFGRGGASRAPEGRGGEQPPFHPHPKPSFSVEHTWQLSAEVPAGRFGRGGASHAPEGFGGEQPPNQSSL